MDTFIKRKKDWILHIIREEEILATVFEGTREDERRDDIKRGRQEQFVITKATDRTSCNDNANTEQMLNRVYST